MNWSENIDMNAIITINKTIRKSKETYLAHAKALQCQKEGEGTEQKVMLICDMTTIKKENTHFNQAATSGIEKPNHFYTCYNCNTPYIIFMVKF